MNKKTLGWIIILAAILLPFNFVYVRMDVSSPSALLIGFLITLVLVTIGFALISQSSGKNS
jgi:hypothetical protein